MFLLAYAGTFLFQRYHLATGWMKVLKGIEIFSLPIYVIFFYFAGASLHIEIHGEELVFTFILIIARFLLNFIENYFGAVLARENKMLGPVLLKYVFVKSDDAKFQE